MIYMLLGQWNPCPGYLLGGESTPLHVSECVCLEAVIIAVLHSWHISLQVGGTGPLALCGGARRVLNLLLQPVLLSFQFDASNVISVWSLRRVSRNAYMNTHARTHIGTTHA